MALNMSVIALALLSGLFQPQVIPDMSGTWVVMMKDPATQAPLEERISIVQTPSSLTMTYRFNGVLFEETLYRPGEVVERPYRTSPYLLKVDSALKDGALVATLTIRTQGAEQKVLRVEEQRWHLEGERLVKESTLTATSAGIRSPTNTTTFQRPQSELLSPRLGR